MRLGRLLILTLAGVAGLFAGSRSFHAGVVTRSFQPKRADYNWRGAKTKALITGVWYPVSVAIAEQPRWVGDPESAFASAGMAAPGAEMAAAPARFPLVLLSHGSGGSALMLAWLGTELARHGYIAAAVNHPGNNGMEEYTPQGFALWSERATDISQVLDAMLADAMFGSRIDSKRVGAAGFSLGGFTMIELAGGIGTLDRYLRFCQSPQAGDSCRDPLEFPDLGARVAEVTKSDSEFARSVKKSEQSHQEERIRAVFAIAPALGPSFRVEDLRHISIPVSIVAGEADEVVPIGTNARMFAKEIPKARLKLYEGGVGHYTFLGTCTETGKKARPGLCVDAAGVDRDAIHRDTAERAVKFFDGTL